MPAVDADAYGDRELPLDDRPRRSQHPTFVIVLCDRNSGDEDDLAAVRVDVGRKKGDLLLIGRVLHTRNNLVQRLGSRVASVRR